MGAKWKESENSRHVSGPKTQIADNIASVEYGITNQILACEMCTKGYKIIAKELEFYKSMRIPVPHRCADCRNMERLKFRNPRKLCERKCEKCSAEIQTTYSSDRPETVYCEKCYLEAVY